MRLDTRQRLLDISARFYQRHGDSFDTTRVHPWPGWDRVWEYVSDRAHPDQPLACLDAGCGNGRFGLFLAKRLGEQQTALRYVGLDLDPVLLEAARRDLVDQSDTSLHCVDLVTNDLHAPPASQDLVVLFGVLHHVPDESVRWGLLRRLARCVAPAGILVVSIWRLDQDADRFARKSIDWSEWNAGCEPARRIDPSDLDPGDALLSWRGDRSTPRYCHFPTDPEIERLAEPSPELEIVDRFEADGPTGRDNLYLVWRRRPSC